MANLNPGSEKAALYLEDLRVGQRFVSGTHRIDEEQIQAFAQQFDPQPFHLDADAAKETFFGGPAWIVRDPLHWDGPNTSIGKDDI
jgi:acyl dehydratase